MYKHTMNFVYICAISSVLVRAQTTYKMQSTFSLLVLLNTVTDNYILGYIARSLKNQCSKCMSAFISQL